MNVRKKQIGLIGLAVVCALMIPSAFRDFNGGLGAWIFGFIGLIFVLLLLGLAVNYNNILGLKEYKKTKVQNNKTWYLLLILIASLFAIVLLT